MTLLQVKGATYIFPKPRTPVTNPFAAVAHQALPKEPAPGPAQFSAGVDNRAGPSATAGPAAGVDNRAGPAAGFPAATGVDNAAVPSSRPPLEAPYTANFRKPGSIFRNRVLGAGEGGRGDSVGGMGGAESERFSFDSAMDPSNLGPLVASLINDLQRENAALWQQVPSAR